ncbi:MAG: hypothetical protein RIS82_591, partial [Actinomycetota bacterium]
VVRGEFEVPRQYRLLCGVAIGYPSEASVNQFKAHRLGVSEIKATPKK